MTLPITPVTRVVFSISLVLITIVYATVVIYDPTTARDLAAVYIILIGVLWVILRRTDKPKQERNRMVSND